MKPIYIIGHKNPDVDSIASAIAYQNFKQNTQEGWYIASSAGEVSSELQWLLSYLGVEAPQVVNNVGTRVEDLLDEEESVFTGPDTTLLVLGQTMGGHNIKTIPVLDEQHRLLGLISLGDIAMLYMDALGSGIDVKRARLYLNNCCQRRLGR
jgi:manganese-dependent inorganic pyrophosphatase